MVFQARPRRILALLGPVFLASTLSCGRSHEENQVLKNGEDVLASGSTPTVMDSVPGDVILAGRDVVFNGAAGGDYIGVGGHQAVGGRIHGSVRAAGGEIRVAAVVDRNATIAGGTVIMDSTADIGRNVYLTGGTVEVNGTVRGSIIASGGTVILNGTVGRSVEVGGGALRVGPHAVITGNLRYRVPPEKVHIDPGARISGTVTALPISRGWGLWHMLWVLGFLVAGAAVVALFPRFTAEAAEILPQRPGRAALVGFGWICLVPVAIFILAITMIGLPLALLTAAVYVVSICLASVPSALWLGRRILSGRARTGRRGALVSFLVGGLILLIIGIIPLLGGLVKLVAVLLGLGALLMRAEVMRLERQPV